MLIIAEELDEDVERQARAVLTKLFGNEPAWRTGHFLIKDWRLATDKPPAGWPGPCRPVRDLTDLPVVGAIVFPGGSMLGHPLEYTAEEAAGDLAMLRDHHADHFVIAISIDTEPTHLRLDPDPREKITVRLRNLLGWLADPEFSVEQREPTVSQYLKLVAEDYDGYARACWGYCEASDHLGDALFEVVYLFEPMRDSQDEDLWTEDAVANDPRWATVRAAAQRALDAMPKAE